MVEAALAQGQQRDMAGGRRRRPVCVPAMVVQCSALVLRWLSVSGGVGGSRRMNCGPEGSEVIGWTGWRPAAWPVDWRGAASSSQFVGRVDVRLRLFIFSLKKRER